MQKADSNSSAGTNADSEQKVEDTSVSQHSRKPPVVGSQSHVTTEGCHVLESIRKNCQKENGFYHLSNFDLAKVLKDKGYKNAVSRENSQ